MTLETGLAVWESRLEVHRTVEIFRFAGEEARRISGRASSSRSTPSRAARAAIGRTRRFPRRARARDHAPSTRRCCSSRTSSAPRSPPATRASSGPRRRRRSRLSRSAEILLEAGAPPAARQRRPVLERARRADGARRADQDALLHRQRPRRLVPEERRRDAARHARARWQRRGDRARGRERRLRRRALLPSAASSASGQACISVQRLYAHASIVEELTGKLVERVRALKTGNPLDEETLARRADLRGGRRQGGRPDRGRRRRRRACALRRHPRRHVVAAGGDHRRRPSTSASARRRPSRRSS